MALTDALRETLEVVRELGEASAKEIAEKLGISASGVRKRLAKLVEEGLVKKITDGKKVKFTADEETEEVEEVEEVTETESVEEVTESENAAEEENEDDNLVDIYINGKYTISVEPERVDEVVRRCNPNAEFDHSEGNKRYYTIKSGSKG